MTRADIVAELRRSACEDADPWDIDCTAFLEFMGYVEAGENLSLINRNDFRVLYLIVAQALDQSKEG